MTGLMGASVGGIIFKSWEGPSHLVFLLSAGESVLLVPEYEHSRSIGTVNWYFVIGRDLGVSDSVHCVATISRIIRNNRFASI